ncbi:MAG: metal ABC transporter substrate-binding protein [Oscillospiraceae bacterium]|jgi:zinc transport system substrate-binding protein|nr:metal ABC transporter substrate-binding protein [Oscillospiraceae bacterium]
MKKHGLRRLRLALILMAVLAATLQGCASPEPNIRLTASIYPVYCMLRQLTTGVENVSVECLATVNAGCAHDYQITAADRKLLADSALLAMNGAGMEPYLDPLLPGLSARIVETSAGLALLPGEGHDGEFNPHTWLNPRYASAQSDTLAAALAELLPDQANTIERNRVEATGRYAALDAEINAALAPFKGSPIVTFHPAFEYFAMGCGLTVAATLTDDTHASPSARVLSNVVDVVRDAGITTIFAERESDLTGAQTVSRETGAVIRFLDTAAYPMRDVPDKDVYFAAMRANLAVLLESFDAR